MLLETRLEHPERLDDRGRTMASNDLPLIAGNWKMFTDRPGARALAEGVGEALGAVRGVEVGLFPPFPFLADVVSIAERHGYSVGAQNLYFEAEGAFTGEVAGPMLRSVGCRYVIVGHSERRHVLGEDDEVVRRKVRAALDASLRPVLCVGEKIEEREAGETESVVKRQTESALEGIADTEFASVTLAYEPVWAIGTGRTATPEQARDVHAFLRSVLADLFGGEAADRCRILYGGSVKPGNIEDLMAQEGIQGALVGGASLTSDSFAAIVRGAMKDRG